MVPVIWRNSHLPPPFIEGLAFDGTGRDFRVCAGDDDAPFQLADRNQPPGEAKYLCVVRMYNFWLISPERCARDGVAHFSENIEPHVLEHVRRGQALLIFDLCNEGPAFDRARFDDLHDFLDANRIPADHAVWLSQNRAVARDYAEAYESSRERLLGFENYDFYVKMMAHLFANEYWRRRFIGEDIDLYLDDLYDLRNKTHLALCLNATPRLHRVLTIAALQHYGLLDRSLVSFGGFAYAKGLSLDPAAALKWIADSPDYGFLHEAAAGIAARSPLKVDGFAETGNELVSRIDRQPYLRTFFSIVTETDFDDGAVQRVSEKIVKVACMGHPLVVAGCSGSMRFLGDWGFQDFWPLLSHDYDLFEHSADRFADLFAEIRRIDWAINANPARWLAAAREAGQFNLYHAMGDFLRICQTREDDRALDALTAKLHRLEPVFA